MEHRRREIPSEFLVSGYYWENTRTGSRKVLILMDGTEYAFPVERGVFRDERGLIRR